MARKTDEQVKNTWTLPSLFILNATAMILELVAARLLQPFLGSSNTVWTVIISIMLLANAAGNWLGGRKWKRELTFAVLFMGSSVSDLALLITGTALEGATGLNSGTTPLVIMSLVFISVPCILSGMASPLANTRLLSDSADTGKKSGRIYVIITAGSLIGTVTGGLLLIPGIGTLATLALCVTLLGGCGITASILLKPAKITACIVSAFTVISVVVVLKGNSADVKVVDTADSHIKIYETEMDGEAVRVMEITGGFESAVFLDPDKRDELVFGYPKVYDEVFRFTKGKDKACMIGGAAYQYPRHLIAHYPDKTIDVVELDPGVTETARKYFFLDDFLKEYGTDRIGLYNGDGRLFLNEGADYDVVFNDAFLGEIPAKSLATKEAVSVIKSAMKPDGIYATNIIGKLREEDGRFIPEGFLGYELDTIADGFRYVWLYNAGADEDMDGNYMVFASDIDYGFGGIEFKKGTCGVLTDTWFPIEK